MEGPLVHCDVVTIPVHQHFGKILKTSPPGTNRHRSPHFPIVAYMCLLGSLFRVSAQSKVCHLQGVGVALALFRSLPGLLRDAVDQVAKPAGERRTCVDSHFAKEKGMNPSAGTKSRRKTNNKACCHLLSQDSQNHLQAKEISSSLYLVLVNIMLK